MAQPEMQRGVSLGKLWRYAGGSVVATVCSQLTFLLLYGVLDVAAGVTSVVAWFAGAVPNYWLNRAWTWQRSGRPSLRGELLPYAAIILGTLLLAVVTASFLGVYVVMFGVRFFLLDRLFTRSAGADH